MDLNYYDTEMDDTELDDTLDDTEQNDIELSGELDEEAQETHAVFSMLEHIGTNWTSKNFPRGTAHYPTWEEILRESLRRLTARPSLPVRPPRTYEGHQRILRLENYLKIAIAVALFEAVIILFTI